MTNDLTLTPTPRQPATVALGRDAVPAQIESLGARGVEKFVEFFTAQIRNRNTRNAYKAGCDEFFVWCESLSLHRIEDIRPVHVAAWVEGLTKRFKPATVKQRLSAVNMLFAYLVAGGVIEMNPAASVKAPRLSRQTGATPSLLGEEANALLESIDTSHAVGLRDKALIGSMIYTFGRVSAVLALNVSDVFTQGRRLHLRLLEKGGKELVMPCNHVLEGLLDAYLAGNDWDDAAPLFQSARGRSRILTGNRLSRQNAWDMVQRRARDADIQTDMCNHTFRATGITAFLKNGGELDAARHMAGHADIRTTKLYDRRLQETTLDDVERVRLV